MDRELAEQKAVGKKVPGGGGGKTRAKPFGREGPAFRVWTDDGVPGCGE